MEKEKVITADEFFEQWCIDHRYVAIDDCDDIDRCMAEFAKLHVRAALEAAAEKAEVAFDLDKDLSLKINKDSILNAYSENLIV